MKLMKKQKFNETNGVAVKGVNGNTEYIRGSFLNQLLVNAEKIEFVEETQTAYVKSMGYEFKLSGTEVKIITPTGRTTGSNSSTGYGSRNYCESGTKRVSLSRMWCLVKALSYNALALCDIDNWVHNHLNNQGQAEAEISGNQGLDISNYELCTYSQNKRHGDAWNKAAEMGLYLKFSAYDTRVINIINDNDNVEMIKSMLSLIQHTEN